MSHKLKFLIIFFVLLTATSRVVAASSLTVLVDKVRPAVVTVVVYNMDHSIANIGSGFFVSASGHLVTNYHVLAGKYAADIRTADGITYPIKFVIAENKASDLIKVVVDIPPKEIQWLEISEELPAVAESIVVVGSPMGLEQTVSEGIVSSVREIPAIGNFFQMSAPISPGSSGSPVINMKGQVVGVATFQFSKGQNLNFAISGKSVRDLKDSSPGLSISEWTYRLSSAKPKLAEELCRKGFSFSINGQNRKALQFFKEATEKDPDDATAWYGLGYCYAGLNNTENAIRAYRQAIRANPDDETSHFNLGNYLSKLGRHEEAIAVYKEVIRLNPDFEAAYFNLGLLYSQLGRLDEGKNAFKEVIRINPDALPAHFNIGITYTKLGRYDEALQAHREVIRINPEYAPAYYNLGIIYEKIGKLKQEIQAYKETIRIDPDFAPAHYNMGYALLKKGNKAAALDEYKILKKLDPDIAKQLFEHIYE